MFTIRHEATDGACQISQAKKILALPPQHVKGNYAELHYENTDGGTSTVFGGEVFVMNDEGKTVAVFSLGDNNPQVAGSEGKKK